MNVHALLKLIGDLFDQTLQLTARVRELEQQLAATEARAGQEPER